LNIINIAEKDRDFMSGVTTKAGLQQLAEEVKSDGKLFQAGGKSFHFIFLIRLLLIYTDIHLSVDLFGDTKEFEEIMRRHGSELTW
jgi:hypothetical protein